MTTQQLRQHSTRVPYSEYLDNRVRQLQQREQRAIYWKQMTNRELQFINGERLSEVYRYD